MAGNGLAFVCDDAVAEDLVVVCYSLALHCACEKKVLGPDLL